MSAENILATINVSVNDLGQLVSSDPKFKVYDFIDYTDELTVFDTTEYPPEALRVASIIDTECTSAAPDAEIIQITITAIEFSLETGYPTRVLDRYNSFNQPSSPITPEITKITNITNEMVQGKFLDYERIKEILQGSLHVAHVASFDRKIIEHNLLQHIPSLIDASWACSYSQIEWEGTAKLDYLAFKHGFTYDAHQSHNDTEALLVLLCSTPLDNGLPYLRRLYDASLGLTHTVYAVGSAFDTKDILSKAGFYWSDGKDGGIKAWHKSVPDEQLGELIEFLDKDIYKGKANTAEIYTFDSTVLFSNRKPAANRKPRP